MPEDTNWEERMLRDYGMDPDRARLTFCPESYSQDTADMARYHTWQASVTLMPAGGQQIGLKIVMVCTRCRALAHDVRVDLGPIQQAVEATERPPVPTPSGLVVAQGSLPPAPSR